MMKRILLLWVVLAGFALSGMAQTYYYEFTSIVDPKTGVRREYVGHFYLTFTNQKSIVYESDKNGNKLVSPIGAFFRMSNAVPQLRTYEKCDDLYRFVENSDGMHKYRCHYAKYSYDWSRIILEYSNFLNFSEDYERLNYVSALGVYVAVRKTPPGEQTGPNVLY